MEDEDKMQKQATNEELTELRQRVADLEASETERKQKEQQDAERRLTRERRGLLLLAWSPFLLGVFLLIYNPAYLGRMILSCENRGVVDVVCSQPCGWIMMVMIVVFVSIAHFGIRGSFALLKDRRGMRFVVAVCILAFLVFPALFLVLLGPAVLVIMETPGFIQ